MDNKNKLAKLLALVFAFALLATACGSSSDGDTATTGDDAAQADDSSDAADDATDDAEDDVELTQGDDLLEQIQSRGELNCGVSTVSIGFAVEI